MQTRRLPALWGRAKQTFGVWQPVAFLCSSIALVGCFIALASLWVWDPRKATGLRHQVAVAGRMPTVVAVFSAILRAAISVQLGICCMMFATLAFEYNGVQLRDAAAMSIYRYSASSPYPLILPVLRGAKLEWVGIVPSTLLVLLSALSIATQLLSAILLTDMDPALIPGGVRATAVSNISDPPDSVRAALAESYRQVITINNEPPFPKFVEEAGENSTRSEGHNGPGLVDSGKLERALIPLNISDIPHLVYYKGPAILLDLRTICVSPQFSNLSLSALSLTTEERHLQGNISADYPIPEGVAGGAKSNRSSKWSDLPSAHKTSLRGSVFCRTPGIPGDTWLDINLCVVYLENGGAGECIRMVGNRCFRGPTAYLLYRWRYATTGFQPEPISAGTFKHNGTEWASYNGGVNQLEMETTLCITDPTIRHATIETNFDPRNLSQPRLEYVWQAGSMVRNYTPVWTLLGEGPGSREPKDRGVFEFKSNEPLYTNGSASWIINAPGDLYSRSPLYSEIIMDYRIPISQRFQSLVWLAYSSYFYTQVERTLTSSALEAQAEHLTTSIVPVRARGLIIVSIIAVVHIISVVLIFYLFFTTNIPKFLDQAWQTIGQLHAGPAKEIIEKCGTAGDWEVAKWSEVEEKWNSPVGFFVEKSASTEEGKMVAIGCKDVSKNGSETDYTVETLPTTTPLMQVDHNPGQDDCRGLSGGGDTYQDAGRV